MTQTKAELLQTRHQGDLKLGDADSSHYVGFKSPATVSSSLVWTLPAADGSSSQLLTTNGSGVLSWSTVSGGISSDAANNTLAGTGAGNSLASGGHSNSFFGKNAGYNVSTGDANNCYGYNAGFSLSTEVGNVFVGTNAGRYSEGAGNVGIGETALQGASSGNSGAHNVGIGLGSGIALNGGLRNSLVGTNAGSQLTTGNYNVMFGYNCGDITTGSENILIGRSATASSQTVSYEATIGSTSITKFRVPGVNFVIKDTTATDNYVLTVDANGEAGWEVATTNLVSDTSPQLGGDLDVQTSEIKTATSNRNIKLNPHGSGVVEVKGDGSSNDGTIQLNCSQNSHGIKIKSPPHSASASYTFTFPNDIQNGKFLTTDSGGNTSWTSISISSDAQENTIAGTDAGGSFSGNNATSNSLFGYRAGGGITTGDYNTVIGRYAGYGTTTGGYNSFYGNNAGRAVTTGSSNIAIGSQALGYSSGACTGADNIALGTDALYQATSSEKNVAIGYYCGREITTGSKNIAIGDEAGRQLTTGFRNTLLGRTASHSVTTGSYNVCLGDQAAKNNTTGSYNIAIGEQALIGTSGSSTPAYTIAIGKASLAVVTSGTDNIAIGNYAGGSLTTGSDNTFVGPHAGDNVTTGGKNIVIGRYADASSATVNYEATIGSTSIVKFRIPGVDFVLKENGGAPSVGQVLTADSNGEGYWAASGGSDAQSNTIGGTGAGAALGSGAYNNSFFGHDAGEDVTTGDQNTYIGDECGRKQTTGSYNTAVGHAAGPGIYTATGNYNTSVGYYVHKKLTSGYENVAMGRSAMFETTTGYYNTAVGKGAGQNVTTSYNNLLLGYNAGLAGSPSGNITTSNNNVCLGNDSIQNLYCQDTSISSSDKRDKTDVADFTHGLTWINKLKPVTYRWDKRSWYTEYNDDGSVKSTATPDGTKKKARQHIGFLAQDVLAVEQADGFASKKDDMLVVNLNEDDTAYGLKYERLVPVLVNAIKELSARIVALEG